MEEDGVESLQLQGALTSTAVAGAQTPSLTRPSLPNDPQLLAAGCRQSAPRGSFNTGALFLAHGPLCPPNGGLSREAALDEWQLTEERPALQNGKSAAV